MLTLERPPEIAPSGLKERALSADEELFSEGARPAALYVVKSGWVKLVRSSSMGRDTITELLFPGDIFDFPSLVDGLPYLMRASSLSSACAVVHCYDRSRALSDPSLVASAQRQCMERVRFQRRMLAALATERVEHRAVMALWMLGERSGHAQLGRVSFTMPLTRQEFGELIGTTTETAIRILSELRRRGWVLEDNRTLTLCHLDELRAMTVAA